MNFQLIFLLLVADVGKVWSTAVSLLGNLTVEMVLPMIAVFGGLVSMVVLVIFEPRKTPKQEAEMIEREDEAMSKLPDDHMSWEGGSPNALDAFVELSTLAGFLMQDVVVRFFLTLFPRKKNNVPVNPPLPRVAD